MESFVSELAQEVRCSLCKDRFIEPKLLKCFHTYCKACIKRHAELQTDGEGNIFKCPECLAETSLPELNDVDDFNPSPLHTRILKVLEFVERDKVCSVSKSHSTASWYCFDCTRSLCDECQINHSLFTKDHHKVVSLSNLKKEDLEFMLAKEDNCDRHSGCKLDFFCQNCEVLVCVECLKSDHGDHKTILNEKHATTVKESLNDQLKKLSTQEEKMSSDVKVLEDFAVGTKNKGEKAIKDIQAKAKEIIEKVQQSERELIKEIQEQIDISEKEKKKGWNVLNKTRSAKSFVTQAIEKRLPANHMKNVKDLVRPMTDDVVPNIQEDSRIVFVPSEECSGLMKVGLGNLLREESHNVSNNRHENDDAWIEENWEQPAYLVSSQKTPMSAPVDENEMKNEFAPPFPEAPTDDQKELANKKKKRNNKRKKRYYLERKVEEYTVQGECSDKSYSVNGRPQQKS